MTPALKESLRDIIKGSASTLLLFLSYAVFPMIGTPAGVLSPYPALFYALKRGRTSGLAIVLVTLAVLALTDPTIALLYMVQGGLLSLLLAEFLRRGNGGARSIAGAVAGVTILAIVTAAACSLASGIDLNRMVQTGIAASIKQTAALYQKGGLSSEDLSAVNEALKQSGVFIGTAYPALMILLMVAFAGVNLSLLGRNTGRLPEPPAIGRFSGYRTPDHLVWLLIASGFCLLLEQPGLFQAALNILIVTLGLYFIQGLAIITSFFDRLKLSALMRGIFYLLLAVQPYLAVGVALLGLFDLWFNFRTPKKGENL